MCETAAEYTGSYRESLPTYLHSYCGGNGLIKAILKMQGFFKVYRFYFAGIKKIHA